VNERPDSWDFAMNFLGEPESSEIEAYVARLEGDIERMKSLLLEALEDGRYELSEEWIETVEKLTGLWDEMLHHAWEVYRDTVKSGELINRDHWKDYIERHRQAWAWFCGRS